VTEQRRKPRGWSRRAIGAACLAIVLGLAPGASSEPKKPKGKTPSASSAAPAVKGKAPAAASATPSGGGKPSPSAKSPASADTTAPTREPEATSGVVAQPAASAEVPASPAPAVVPRKTAPPAPAPTRDQLSALEELQREGEAYEKAARDYRGAITRIVEHHYQDRRRRILAALDAEVAVEKKGLREAREEAIHRLETFVQRYSGANAHPENSPDAMFRLAALYEERARTDTETSEELAAGLLPAVSLYKRVIREFPKYRELAGVFYYLGHALNDSSRLAEAQQVWRSMVCSNHYRYPVATDPKDPTKDTIGKLIQDHDQDYWIGWRNRHPQPIGPAQPAPAKHVAAAKPHGDEAIEDDEIRFKNPYFEDCQAIPQKTLPGAEPRYVAEGWWLVADYHFNDLDAAGGPFNLNRAEAGYQRALKYKKPPVYGVAMYKLAWTYFKQQRYETSVHAFIDLLRYTDEQEKLTGDPGADFRQEAFTYIAGSLTYDDFKGPGADEPDIPRTDIFDTESGAGLEAKMREAIRRVQDPRLVPQDERWTVDIYKALAKEFIDLKQYRNTIEVSELILQKWPFNRDAPEVQSRIADMYDTLTAQSREGTAERAANSARALEARTKLARYVGSTDWVEKNKNDPEAIQNAEHLVKGGIRRAAADHTNAGSHFVQEAISIGDKESRDPMFERALTEYRLAATGWAGYLAQDENASDAYESRYWLADANHNIVAIVVALDHSLSASEIDAARTTAIAVRDSNEDDKFLEPAAWMVVDSAQQAVVDQNQAYRRSGGSSGIEPRDKVKLENEGTEQVKVITEPVPPVLLAAIAARDEYVERVPAAADVNKRSDGYAFQAADAYFLYGQFAEARKRFEPIYKNQCGKSEFGYRAWERLTTMSNLLGDIEQSRVLAEAALQHSCAVSEEQKLKEDGIARPTISKGYYVDAARAYEKAEKMADGPDRDKAWREAAALYKIALEKAPARDEAPEAAIYGARAYKQVGEYDQAIGMYELFIKEYGNEANLSKLEKGDPKGNPPKAADPKKYEERVKYLKDAYDALSASYVLFFNYRKAAETYDVIARNARFEKAARRGAARNAVLLYANLGDRDKMLMSRQTFFTLEPPAEQKADIDYLVASSDLKSWDEHGPDEGANRNARTKAVSAMETYFMTNKGNAAAAQYVVDAAYNSYKLRKVVKDPQAKDWCKSTVTAFERYRSGAPTVNGHNKALGSLESDMAGECAYLAIDEKLRADFDYDTGHHRYAGVVDKVKIAFDADVKKANDDYFKQLKKIVDDFASRPWSVAVKARQGSLYDSCRTGLYNTRPPGLKLYTEKEEKLLKLAETSDREDLQETADAIRQTRREQWRKARETSLNDADHAMVKFYVEAVVYARAFKVRNPAVDLAIQRLAFFTDILGEAKMREFTTGIEDLEIDPTSGESTKRPFQYVDGMFLRMRPGATPPLVPDGVAAPLPVKP